MVSLEIRAFPAAFTLSGKPGTKEAITSVELTITADEISHKNFRTCARDPTDMVIPRNLSEKNFSELQKLIEKIFRISGSFLGKDFLEKGQPEDLGDIP
jgi:hypothetical protein